MLNDVIYHQYLETEKAYLEQKKSEEQAKQMPDKGTTQDATQTEREQELHSMVAEGMELMDYYLPTTLKLVEQYAEFDEVSSPGEEILEAKKEIGKTLDMINQAFVTLLNNLFQDAAFDASADAQVLQAMLAKEGLTESDFVMEKQ